jgi:hypothetical protein
VLTEVEELDAPQRDGEEDGIGHPLAPYYGGPQDEETGGDVDPIGILPRKQVAHLARFAN